MIWLSITIGALLVSAMMVYACAYRSKSYRESVERELQARRFEYAAGRFCAAVELRNHLRDVNASQSTVRRANEQVRRTQVDLEALIYADSNLPAS